jgi:nucleotide-binding universal stress UspA family protein
MLNVRKVLFPTDFSPFSQRALPYAAHLAGKHGAELHILHAIVLHDDDPHDPAHHFPDFLEVRSVLEELANERMGTLIREHDIPDLVLKLVHRRDISAAPPIVEYAQEEDIDLVVMGTHGRRGVRKLLLGSVTNEVIRLAPCSVLTVRGEGEGSPVRETNRVLVPVDFSEPGKEALAVACNVASTLGAELQLAHVLHDVPHPPLYTKGTTRLSDMKPDIHQSTESSLEELLDETGDCQGAPAGFFALEGHPGREIVRFSRDHGSGLIVMATHGLTGIKHFLLGGIAEKVIAGAECPVLVVKASGRSLLP